MNRRSAPRDQQPAVARSLSSLIIQETIMTNRCLLAILAMLIAAPAFAQGNVSLFKVVSVKDEVVIGLSPNELSGLGGSDAGAVAKALQTKGTLTVSQYATRKPANGDLEQAPRAKIGLIAHDSLRIEPYVSPLKVLPHE